jgi:hypothetical protein
MNTKLSPIKTFGFLIALMMSLSGCVYMIVGGIGALGGYIISPDTVEGITGHEQSDVWDAAHEVMSVMGTISDSKEAGGILIANASGVKVTITMVSINSSSTKITIKARRGIFPKIGLAQEVYSKIITHLNE